MILKRHIQSSLIKDLDRKLILLTGPRQCGKTTLSKNVFSNAVYLNYDNEEDRREILHKSWPKDADLLILDEIHRMNKWKLWLKGVYDKKPSHMRMLVTGSARLDTARKVGDSLAGRHFTYRLYPFDLAEIKSQGLNSSIQELFKFSNFPEPFLERDAGYYHKWRRSHLDLILRQDLLSLEAIRDISSIETLIALLRERVGSSTSYASLARDLQRDESTIKRWLTILENLYIIFAIRPYSKNVARAILKEPKYYFYDSATVEGNDGDKLENLVAFSLLKLCHGLEDMEGQPLTLHFVKSKDKVEVDFLICNKGVPKVLIEVKWNEQNLSSQLFHFKKFFPKVKLLTVTGVLSRPKIEYPEGDVVRAQEWLEDLWKKDHLLHHLL